MKVRVIIELKDGVADPQGQTIANALGRIGVEGVRTVRVAKSLDVDIDAVDRASAEARIREACERLLANPVIETYHIEWPASALEG